LLPYRRARSLLDEFFLVGDAPEVETLRQRTLHVGARLERDAVKLPPSAAPTEVPSIALAIDGGHVNAVRSYQGRSFEVFLAQVSNDNGERVVFSRPSTGIMPTQSGGHVVRIEARRNQPQALDGLSNYKSANPIFPEVTAMPAAA